MVLNISATDFRHGIKHISRRLSTWY